MNILFVHEVDWLRRVVYEIHTLSELLSLRGHNVYAIDYEALWTKSRFLDFGTLKTTDQIVSRAYLGATVHLVRPGFVKIPALSRLVYSLLYYVVVEKVVAERNIDVILLYSAPTNGLQTLLAGWMLGVPVVFRSLDILHRLVDNPLLSVATRQMEQVVYSRSDRILTITPALSRYVICSGAYSARVDVLPLGIDTEMFRPVTRDTELLHLLGFKDSDKVIVFVGTLPHFSGLDVFIRQFVGIRRMIPSLKLLIVGDGVQRPKLESLIDELGLREHVLITGFVTHEKVPGFINLADVCINPFVVSDTTRDIFPTKVIQYAACGKPVVSSPLDGLKEMGVGEKQGVLYVEDGDWMSPTVTAILNSDSLGRAARDYSVRVHSYDKVVEQLEAELAKICKEKNRG
tara:strand:- start:131 stop:1336 length:1206 start_codon:yes stop_codon:yes gene_type:complete